MKLLNQTTKPRVARGSEKAAAAVRRVSAALGGTSRPGRYALRFFAAMLVLTLVARGTSGAAMAKVGLTTPSQGAIVQQASASAVITAGEGETLPLPEGVTVEAVYAVAGQQLKAGDAVLKLNLEELEDALASAKALCAQQQAQLDQLSASTPTDTSSVDSAQQSLARAQEDYARADERTRAAADEANAALAAAQTGYDDAARRLAELQSQTDLQPTEEELAAAQQAADEAKSALDSARQAAQSAAASREDTLLSAKRSVENAQSSLSQANTAYSEAQASAALTAQTNAAQAESLRLEKAKNDETISLLSGLIESGGTVYAPRDAQLLECSLAQGEPCPDGGLRLAKEGSELLVQFSLSCEQAEKLSAGQAVTVTQGTVSAEASVRTVEDAGEDETSRVTAVLPDGAGFKAGAAQAELVFSRTVYGTCVPVSAIRQDTQGSYVLTVDESRSAFGVTYTARRVPVTVLEVDSAGQYAAIEGGAGGGVITSSDRAVSPGASVRLEQ